MIMLLEEENLAYPRFTGVRRNGQGTTAYIKGVVTEQARDHYFREAASNAAGL